MNNPISSLVIATLVLLFPASCSDNSGSETLGSVSASTDERSSIPDKPEFAWRTPDEIKVDLLGESFGGSYRTFGSLGDFMCLKIHDQEQKADGAIAEYNVRLAMDWGSSGHLADLILTYKISGGVQSYVSHSVVYDFANATENSCESQFRR